LRLKSQVAAAHPSRIDRHKQAGDTRQQHRLQRVQIPFIARDKIKVVVRVQLAAFIDDMGLTFDIRD